MTLRRLALALLLAAPFLLPGRPLPAQDRAAAQLQSSRPNIVFVFSDDHAAHAISAYGSRINHTPNIDRLAQDGLLFRNNFCGNALCGPSRATILTGKHSHENGFMRNGNVFDGGQTTFPKLLQQAGYQTAIVGKWHLESEPQGFHSWAVLPGQGHYYNPDFLTKDGKVRMQGHVTDLTTDMAIEWLEQGRDPERPFLLMCQHKAPHREWMPALSDLGLYRDVEIPEPPTLFDDHAGRVPALSRTEMEIDRHMFLHYDLMIEPTDAERPHLQGPDAWWDGIMKRLDRSQREAFMAAFREENEAFRRAGLQGRDLVSWKYQRYIKNYLRCVNGVDRSVGRLLDWLRARPEIERNTIVVYSSDQGFFLGDHGFYDKRWMDEECFRMPLLVRWPGRIQGGREVQELTQNIDFAPTFLDLAGVPTPADMHGTSLVPLLEGQRPKGWRDAVYYHYYESQATHAVPAMYGVRTSRHKLIRYYEPHEDCWELFDLATDPDELRNVAEDPAHQEIRRTLERRLAALRTQYRDTTGDLGGGAFAKVAGIARAREDQGGWTVWANAQQGYALLGSSPGRDFRAVKTTLTPQAGRQLKNGCLVFQGAGERPAMLRANIAFGARRLQILAGAKAVTETPIDWDGSTPIALTVEFDPDGRTIAIAAQGRRIEAPLPDGWTGIDAWGYGASNAETRFAHPTFD